MLRFISVLLALCWPVLSQALPIQQLRFPPGFKIERIATVENARQISQAPDGTLFAGSRNAGKIYRLRKDAQGQYQVETLISGLAMPSGVAFHDDTLYVAALNRILRLEQPLQDKPGSWQKVTDYLPDREHHGWKYLKVGPDGQLYFNIGAPCNACLSENPRYATLTRLTLDGSQLEVIAEGVRNSVGFDWHPDDLALWFTDNGRDWLGDDQPDDELNRLSSPGQHFGFPYLHGNNLPDPHFGTLAPPPSETPAALLGAHVAPLGMAFTQQQPWAAPGETSLFIAQHGSWNRSKKVGYRVVKVRLEGNRVLSVEPFIYGWLQGQSYWGRPVDVLFDSDNNLLISDDYGDAIYRLSPLQ